MKKIVFSMLAWLITCSYTKGQDTLPFSFTAFVEEDSFNDTYNKDQNYTGGGAVTLGGGFTNSNLFLIPFLRKGFERVTGINRVIRYLAKRNDTDIPDHVGSSFSFGTSVFTPQDIGTPLIVNGDRPYASLAFASSKEVRIWNDPNDGSDNFAVVSELNLGWLGSDLGDTLQTRIHRSKINKHPNDTNNRPLPLGWPNQVSYGGEITAMYKLALINSVKEINWGNSPFHAIQVSSLNEINIGYYTNVASGLTCRIGFFSSRMWQNNSNFGNSTNLAPSSFTRGKKFIYSNFEVYGFASGRARLIGYNALLEGQFKQSRYTLGSKDINHLIAEFEVGVALRIWRLNFIYEPIAGRTSELNTPYSRTHIWGAYYFSLAWPLN